MKRQIKKLNGRISFVNDDPSKPSPNLPVSEFLAKMIESTVKKTKISLNINSTTGGKHSARSFHKFGQAADINIINKKRIDDISNSKSVKRFQKIISQHTDIAECFGPFINIRKHGSKITKKRNMRIKHLNHLHISSQR